MIDVTRPAREPNSYVEPSVAGGKCDVLDLTLLIRATPLPPSTHCRLAIEALAAGKHVFLEKPIAGTMEEARTILEAAQSSDRVVQIGFCELISSMWLTHSRRQDSGTLPKGVSLPETIPR